MPLPRRLRTASPLLQHPSPTAKVLQPALLLPAARLWARPCTCQGVAKAANTPATAAPLTAPTNPQPVGRYDASMTYDPALGFVLLFGGANVTEYPTSCGGHPYAIVCTVVIGDTWGFSDGVWTNLTVHIIGSSPTARWGAPMAYSPQSQTVMLYGGSTATGYVSDCWTFSGNRVTNQYYWTACNQGGLFPPARAFGGLTYDITDSELVLFGGVSTTGPLGDTWTYSGSSWTQLIYASGSVPERKVELHNGL